MIARHGRTPPCAPIEAARGCTISNRHGRDRTLRRLVAIRELPFIPGAMPRRTSSSRRSASRATSRRKDFVAGVGRPEEADLVGVVGSLASSRKIGAARRGNGRASHRLEHGAGPRVARPDDRLRGAPLFRDRREGGVRSDPGSAAHHSAMLHAALRPGNLAELNAAIQDGAISKNEQPSIAIVGTNERDLRHQCM